MQDYWIYIHLDDVTFLPSSKLTRESTEADAQHTCIP